MKEKFQHIDIEIDKLTNSIENSISGDTFPTDVLLVESADLKKITKKNGWLLHVKHHSIVDLRAMFLLRPKLS